MLQNKGNIYLIYDLTNQAYKIGVTKRDCEKRLKQLQTGNPNELELIFHKSTDHPYRLESMLHHCFNEKKILNEWFDLSEEDVINFEETTLKYENIINSLKDNPFFIKR